MFNTECPPVQSRGYRDLEWLGLALIVEMAWKGPIDWHLHNASRTWELSRILAIVQISNGQGSQQPWSLADLGMLALGCTMSAPKNFPISEGSFVKLSHVGRDNLGRSYLATLSVCVLVAVWRPHIYSGLILHLVTILYGGKMQIVYMFTKLIKSFDSINFCYINDSLGSLSAWHRRYYRRPWKKKICPVAPPSMLMCRNTSQTYKGRYAQRSSIDNYNTIKNFLVAWDCLTYGVMLTWLWSRFKSHRSMLVGEVESRRKEPLIWHGWAQTIYEASAK